MHWQWKLLLAPAADRARTLLCIGGEDLAPPAHCRGATHGRFASRSRCRGHRVFFPFEEPTAERLQTQLEGIDARQNGKDLGEGAS